MNRADEGRHLPKAAAWEERWWFDSAAADIGVMASLILRPAERVAWWAAALVRTGEPLVSITATDVGIPARGLEVRTDGIWACLTCETPGSHWTVGLEAYAVALDDPFDAWSGARGVLVPFGLDLEWEAEADVEWRGDGYGQHCRVSGDVLLGSERIELTSAGHRRHRWGPPERGWDLAGPTTWVSGTGPAPEAFEPSHWSPVRWPDGDEINASGRIGGDGWGWVSGPGTSLPPRSPG